MVTQALYSIEFFDNERNLMPYCYFELYINGNLVTGLPPRADSHGKVWITRELVESMDGIPKMLSIRLWNSTFPKTQNSETEEFIWPEGKTSIKAFLPDVYTINTRPLANENDEEQSYQRAYYLVRKGDTWTKLEIELGSNTVEALMLHNRMSYADQLVEGAKLYYPLGFRTRNEVGSNTGKKPSEKKEERKEEKKAQPRTAKKEPEKKVEQPKKMKEEEKSQKLEKKEEPKPGETKQENTIEQRSQANGKPEEVAKPKKDGCFCYRDFTVEELKSIILEMRKFSKNPYKNLFYEKNCPLPEDEKSFERLTEEINKTFKTWEINTCMRKIQFLAQCYHESAFFSTTLEFASGEHYNPPNPKKPGVKTHKDAIKHGHKIQGDGPRYKGRGLIQQTWRDTQIAYYKNVVKRFPNYFLGKRIDERNVEKELFNRSSVYTEKAGSKEYQCDHAALIARDLFLSCDSAGWFWGLFKTRYGKTLNYLSDFGVYGNGTITWMVHGGGETISIRLNLYRHLRDKVFDYSNKCINKINHIKKDELLNKDLFKQKSYWGGIKDEEN